MLLEGNIELENAIPVTIDCLGKQFPIEIAGVKGFLATPRMFAGFNGSDKLGQLETPDEGLIVYKSSFDWGSVNSWPKGDSEIRAFKIIFPNIEKKQFEEAGNKIARDLPAWRNLLIDNISYTLRTDYRGPRRSKTYTATYGLGEFALYKKPKGPDNWFIPDEHKRITIAITVGKSRGFNPELLARTVLDTSKNKDPLFPFYFFLDAERALFDGNYRKVILDSATALEICFSLVIGNILSTTNNLNKYILSKHNSLLQKRELLKVLEISLPKEEKEYKEYVDAIRNKVIHAGYRPTEKQARTALKITEDALYTLLAEDEKY